MSVYAGIETDEQLGRRLDVLAWLDRPLKPCTRTEAQILRDHPEWSHLAGYAPVRDATPDETTRYAALRKDPDWRDIYRWDLRGELRLPGDPDDDELDEQIAEQTAWQQAEELDGYGDDDETTEVSG